MQSTSTSIDNPTPCAAFQTPSESITVIADMVSEVCVYKLFVQKKYQKANDARYAMFTMATRADNVMPPNQDVLHLQPFQICSLSNAIS